MRWTRSSLMSNRILLFTDDSRDGDNIIRGDITTEGDCHIAYVYTKAAWCIDATCTFKSFEEAKAWVEVTVELRR